MLDRNWCSPFVSTEVIIINASEDSTFEEDLANDVIEIVTVFSARKVSTEYVRSTHQLTSKTLTSGRLRTLFHLLFTWSVDPDLGVEGGWGRNLVYKAFGVVLIGAFQNLGSSFGDRFGVSLMDISWGHECNA